MAEKPTVSPGDWITFGSGSLSKSAVVCKVYQDTSLADIEVVYLDDRNRAINEDMVWKDSEWHFKHPGPSGGYADNYSRLRSYVAQLRRGKY
jgi:hypothetical protein